MPYSKEDIDKEAENEGRALRGVEQRQNVNHDRNRAKSGHSGGRNKFDKLFRS